MRLKKLLKLTLTSLFKKIIVVKIKEKKSKNKKIYFRIFLWKINSKKIENKKSIRGILFPESIIPIKRIKNIIGAIYIKYFFEVFIKNKGNTKKEKKENL
tara:strand:- start:31 stop:330 length:300 start_codon:yes stop_codon:yes gene_type:complete